MSNGSAVVELIDKTCGTGGGNRQASGISMEDLPAFPTLAERNIFKIFETQILEVGALIPSPFKSQRKSLVYLIAHQGVRILDLHKILSGGT